MPFPTNLVGTAPQEQVAVLSFIGLFLVLSVLWVCLILRAHSLDMWQRRMTDEIYRWLLADWLASISVAFVVAIWAPIAGLALLALASVVVGVAMGRVVPPSARSGSEAAGDRPHGPIPAHRNDVTVDTRRVWADTGGNEPPKGALR